MLVPPGLRHKPKVNTPLTSSFVACCLRFFLSCDAVLLSEQLFIYLENTHGRAKAAPTTRSVSRTIQSPCSHSYPSIFATEEGSWALSRAVAIENNSRAGFQQPEKHNRNHQLERKRAHTVGIHRFKAVSYSNS